MCHDGKGWLTYFPQSRDFALYPDTQLVFFDLFQIMGEYDQTFDPNILTGHCDLISQFSDLPYIFTLSIFSY